MPSWRNWIARMTSNHEVAGSSPAMGDNFYKIDIFFITCFIVITIKHGITKYSRNYSTKILAF